jgi:hypothetical protein
MTKVRFRPIPLCDQRDQSRIDPQRATSPIRPRGTVFLLDEPVDIAGNQYDYVRFRHFCHDPSMAPPGRSALVTTLSSDYCY